MLLFVHKIQKLHFFKNSCLQMILNIIGEPKNIFIKYKGTNIVAVINDRNIYVQIGT